jgi:hypothetical protein
MSDENDRAYPPQIRMHTNTDTGISWPDALSLMAYEQAMSAKGTRLAQGLDSIRPIPSDQIDTKPFAHCCTVTRTEYPPGAMHRRRYLSISAKYLPAEVKERLCEADPEVGAWLREDEELIPLGEEMALGLPRNPIPVAELVALIKASGPSPAEQRRRWEEENRKRYPGK